MRGARPLFLTEWSLSLKVSLKPRLDKPRRLFIKFQSNYSLGYKKQKIRHFKSPFIGQVGEVAGAVLKIALRAFIFSKLDRAGKES